ncbi:hypothetical protein QLX08_008083 [Tetragonisca angustula]|uniref:Uncharacterized protein n=1 Tax=Tetragonisca angustula TaxID=166442 RepID=A0AAW0ZM63_9HYME
MAACSPLWTIIGLRIRQESLWNPKTSVLVSALCLCKRRFFDLTVEEFSTSRISDIEFPNVRQHKMFTISTRFQFCS